MSPRLAAIARSFAALVLLALSASVFAPAPAGANGSSIGVDVQNPTTTTTSAPPPTAAPPSPTTVPPTTTTVPSTTTTTTAAPTTPTTLPPGIEEVPDVAPFATVEAESPEDKGIIKNFKGAAKTTKELVSDVISGKPVADVVEAILPPKVATVVVPAVRTAGTFVFPIGLAAAVVAFLSLQQRIDSSDPKLSAAPLAHDDEIVEFS